MLDSVGRVTITRELLEKSEYVKRGGRVKIFFNPNKKALLLNPSTDKLHDAYFLVTHKIDGKGRVFIPKIIRTTFPNVTYLPAEQDGEIYILIIE